MSKIKTREKATGKDIKMLDKSAVVGHEAFCQVLFLSY